MTSTTNPNPLLSVVEAKLTVNDDRNLWQVAIGVLTAEFQQLYEENARSREWLFVIGACSHWIRPHQTRWTASGGFAWPQGYASRRPELDWSAMCAVDAQRWLPVDKWSGPKTVSFSVAVPSRTARHRQAAIYAKWSTSPKPIFYGFRKIDGQWKVVVASDEEARGRIGSE